MYMHMHLDLSDKIGILEEHFSKEKIYLLTFYPGERNVLKDLFKTLKRKLMECTRNRKYFVDRNEEWLKRNITLMIQRTIELEKMEWEDQVKPSTSSKNMGRPPKKFEDMSERTKRRVTKDLRESHSTAQLTFAARMSLRASEASKATSVIKDITTTSPSKALKYKRALKSASILRPTEISGNLELSDVVEDRNEEWLKRNITLMIQRTIELEKMEWEDQVKPSTSSKNMGRPPKKFEDMSERTKRRVKKDLRESNSTAQLTFAARMSL
ncbi:unnamed protein product [Brassicogethes aeneus]|uniref:Uncharacterized protein n=1 Tax=Brassicogethes aeneus TaxID=1431903 RepID=A0A9P0FK68_BRAAE|nr:unnamed protein product [Brassicogethes aeneus]